MIKLGGERFEAPEILFQPHLADVEAMGISELLFDTIQKSDIDMRSDFFKHIVLSGGTTMYPGFASRLEREITQLYLERVLRGDVQRLAVNLESKKKLDFSLFFIFRNSNSELRVRQDKSIWSTLAALF